MKKLLLLILLYHCANQQVHAFQPDQFVYDWDSANKEYAIRHFTVEDGLPINSITGLLQLDDGYIYISTFDGLVRFDGNRFVTFNASNSSALRTNRLVRPKLGAEGEIWFTDVQNNVYQFKNDQIQIIKETFNDSDLAFDELIRPENEDESFWIRTNKGLWFQREGLEFERVQDERLHVPLNHCYAESAIKIHCITNEGLFTYNNGHVDKRIPAEEIAYPFQEVRYRMFSSGDDYLWVVTDKAQLIRISEDNEQMVYDFPDIGVFSYLQIRTFEDHSFLIDTDEGLVWVNNEKEEYIVVRTLSELQRLVAEKESYFKDEPLISKFQETVYINGDEIFSAQNTITSFYRDREGTIWVTTSAEGIYQLVPQRITVIRGEDNLVIRNLYGFHEDGDQNVWMASYYNGILNLSDSVFTGWTTDNREIRRAFFRSVYKGKDGIVYAAGETNVWMYKNQQWRTVSRYEAIKGRIDVMFEDSRGQFWIGTDSDLYISTAERARIFESQDGQKIYQIRAIKELENNKLLFLTGGQGIVILNENDRFHFLGVQDGIASDNIRDVYIANRDTFWVATQDQGLNRVILNENQSIKSVAHINRDNGLIDNSLHRIIRDTHGYFWINSNQGVMRIEEKRLNAYLDRKRESFVVQSFFTENGPLRNEGNGGAQHAGLLTKDGKLLFPSQAGLIYTRPDWHLEEEQRPLLDPIIEEFYVSDSTITYNGEASFSIPKNTRDVQIKFTLPTFTSASRLILEYKLEGVNQNWQKVGNERLAVFTNLPPGSHGLTIRGKLPEYDSYSETNVSILVPYKFHETAWFLMAIVVLIGLLFFIGYKMLLRQARLKEEELNKLVKYRTKELVWEQEKTQQALVQVKKMDEAKSHFFTNFTHELRTPLSLILNPLEDMIEGNKVFKEGDDTSRLSMMKRNAERLKELINQLLDVSKLNAGEVSLVIEPTDILVLTKQFASQFEHAFAKKNIQFSITSSATNNEVYIDCNSWEHICTNLLGNALKFTPAEGSISIMIKETKDALNISFRDTGVGISQLDLPYIFDTYYQGESSITKAGGTGIGLALVRGLVERLRGHIRVESNPGEDTIFIVEMKKGFDHFNQEDTVRHEIRDVVQEPEKSSKQKDDNDELNIEDEDQSRAPSVLLVEDNEDFRTYLHSVISEYYRVKVATNGKKGLEVLDTFKPDIILSDIMMPEMDGYEMMRAIRNKERYRHIPFIFLTAKDSVQDLETGLNSGADIYLTKPVRNRLLLTQIRVLLRRERSIQDGLSALQEEKESVLIMNVKNIIHRHLGNPDLSVDLIADVLSMSRATLFRKWKFESKETINQTITMKRLEEAIRLVRVDKLSISEASYSVGYNHISYFSRAFKKVYGESPKEYLKETFS